MTTTTTGTPSPQVRNIVLAVAALAVVAFLALNQGFGTSNVTGQQVAETAVPTLPESVTGFEYGNESTAGHIAAPGITGQYFGYSGELYPEASAPVEVRSFFDEHAATGRVPAKPVLDQATLDRIAPLTWTFLDGPAASTGTASAVRPLAAFAGADLAVDHAVASVPSSGSTAPALPVSVTGFEYTNESTAARFVGEGVTGSYFGHNPEFDTD